MTSPPSFDNHALGARPLVGISVLGSFRLTLGGNHIPIVSESKSEQLLVCLALAQQHSMLRAHLLERIWPLSHSTLAGQSLHSLTHQLNKLTRESLNGEGIIVHEDGYYRLNWPSSVWVDIDQFDAWGETGRRLLSNGDALKGVTYCEQALVLYQGDLYGDSSIQTVIEREQRRLAFLDLLTCLSDYYYNQGNAAKTLCYLQRLLAHEPCREDAHRQAMRCYMHLNQRAQALRQYRLCCQALALEFDATPEPATVTLYDQIRMDPASI